VPEQLPATIGNPKPASFEVMPIFAVCNAILLIPDAKIFPDLIGLHSYKTFIVSMQRISTKNSLYFGLVHLASLIFAAGGHIIWKVKLGVV
jgi:hypothetical protein